jgi:hypothetical protein
MGIECHDQDVEVYGLSYGELVEWLNQAALDIPELHVRRIDTVEGCAPFLTHSQRSLIHEGHMMTIQGNVESFLEIEPIAICSKCKVFQAGWNSDLLVSFLEQRSHVLVYSVPINFLLL